MTSRSYGIEREGREGKGREGKERGKDGRKREELSHYRLSEIKGTPDILMRLSDRSLILDVQCRKKKKKKRGKKK